MKLTNFCQDGWELVINEETGETYASQNALARMCGVTDSTIFSWRTSAQITVLDAEILTATGLKTSPLFDENSIYKTLAKYNPTLLIQCAKAGLRIYLHGLAGYRYQAIPPTPSAPAIPCHVLAVQKADAIRHITDSLADNPSMAQLLIDLSIEDILIQIEEKRFQRFLAKP